jgi:hypothetical protein
MDKKSYIALIRRMQAERDPRKKEALIEEIRQAGPPPEAKVVTGDVIGREGVSADLMGRA